MTIMGVFTWFVKHLQQPISNLPDCPSLSSIPWNTLPIYALVKTLRVIPTTKAQRVYSPCPYNPLAFVANPIKLSLGHLITPLWLTIPTSGMSLIEVGPFALWTFHIYLSPASWTVTLWRPSASVISLTICISGIGRSILVTPTGILL